MAVTLSLNGLAVQLRLATDPVRRGAGGPVRHPAATAGLGELGSCRCHAGRLPRSVPRRGGVALGRLYLRFATGSAWSRVRQFVLQLRLPVHPAQVSAPSRHVRDRDCIVMFDSRLARRG